MLDSITDGYFLWCFLVDQLFKYKNKLFNTNPKIIYLLFNNNGARTKFIILEAARFQSNLDIILLYHIIYRFT